MACASSYISVYFYEIEAPALIRSKTQITSDHHRMSNPLSINKDDSALQLPKHITCSFSASSAPEPKRNL